MSYKIYRTAKYAYKFENVLKRFTPLDDAEKFICLRYPFDILAYQLSVYMSRYPTYSGAEQRSLCLPINLLNRHRLVCLSSLYLGPVVIDQPLFPCLGQGI